jgi:hypothetical protein
MGFLGRPTITMVHFNFQGNFEHFLNFAKKQLNAYYKVYKDFLVRIQFGSHLPICKDFGPQKLQLPSIFFFSTFKHPLDKSPRKGASTARWKIRVE